MLTEAISEESYEVCSETSDSMKAPGSVYNWLKGVKSGKWESD